MRWCLRSLEYFCIISFPAHEKKLIVRPSQASALRLLYALSTRPVPIVLDRHLLSNSFAVLATLSNFCLPENFFQQNIGLENIASPKKMTFSQKTSIYGNFLECLPTCLNIKLFISQRVEMISAKSTTHRKYILLMQPQQLSHVTDH